MKEFIRRKSMKRFSRNYRLSETRALSLQTSLINLRIIFQTHILSFLALFSTFRVFNKRKVIGTAWVLILFLSIFSIPAAHAQSCPLPTAPTNVLVEYPGCVGDNCSLVQASCSWGAVAGATSYSIKITEVDTTTIIREETVTTNQTFIFPVTQNRTYRCEVAAINTCGTGPANQHELLCKVEGLVTQTPQKSCGQPCANQSECIAGTTCLATSTGGSVCAVAGSESACAASPGIATCCSAAPIGGGQTPPVVGTVENLFLIAGIGSFLIFFGSMFFLRNRI